MKSITKTTIPLLLLALLALSSLFASASAATYYGYAEKTDDVGQVFKVWVTVATTGKYIKVKWEGPFLSVMYGFPGGFTGAFIHIEDGKGYEVDALALPRYGTKYFYGYTNTYTWVHVKVSWMYTGAFWVFIQQVKCDVYVKG